MLSAVVLEVYLAVTFFQRLRCSNQDLSLCSKGDEPRDQVEVSRTVFTYVNNPHTS